MKLNKKAVGNILLAIGILAIIFFLSVDLIGIGNDPSTIGWKQILGASAGLVVVVLGLFISRTKKDIPFLKSEKNEDEKML